MASTSPTVTTRRDVDVDVAPAPASGGEANSSSKPATTSKSSSSELDFPGAFPRDPRIVLDHLSDQAGPSVSADSGTVLEAARGDVRRAVDAAAIYLPESVVGAIGSVFPVGTTNTDEVDKKLDPSEASHGLSASDFAVGGIATDLYPSTHNPLASPSAATGVPLPSSESSNTNIDAKAGANTPKGPFSEGLSKTNAPANIASASSLGASSIPPGYIPPTEAENEEGKEKNKKEKPAFATYAPAPVITGSRSALGASNTPSATQQFTAPSVGYAPDSTAQKDLSLDTPAASPTPVPRAKPSLNTTQSLKGRTDAQNPVVSAPSMDSREKKAAEIAALGAGIGTLGGAAYVSSGSPAQTRKPAPADSQAPFENSATANQTQPAASHVPSNTIAPVRALRETSEENPSAAAPGDQKNAQDVENEAADKKAEKKAEKEAKHAGKEEKKAEKSAKKAEKKAEKEQHKEEAAAAAAAEAADKKAQKGAKEREREDKRREKEFAAAALAADKETLKEAKERAKEVKQAEKEANNKEKEEPKTVKGSKKTEETAAALAATSAEKQKARHSQEDTLDSAMQQPAAELKSSAQGSASAPTAVSGPSSDNAPGGPPINPARPAPTALGGSGSGGSYEPAKSGVDSDCPLPSANASVSSGVHAIDLNGKGTDTSPSAAARQTAPPAEGDSLRYLGTEGLQEKFEGGALRSSFINRNQGEGSSRFKEHNELDKDGDAGTERSGEPKKESRVKHFIEKVKDKLHHH